MNKTKMELIWLQKLTYFQIGLKNEDEAKDFLILIEIEQNEKIFFRLSKE
jgi:hypothetical protein